MIDIIKILNALATINENLTNGTEVSAVLEIGIATVVSIMAVALPLLVNSISKLDNRYDSLYVVNEFCKDWTIWTFGIMLVLSICAIIFWAIAFFCHCKCALPVVQIVLLICVSLLVITLICLIIQIVRYGIPTQLFQIIKSKEERLEAPKHYYDNQRDKKTATENETFNKKTYKCYSILACLYIESSKRGNQLQQEILKFWQKKCTPKTPNEKEILHPYLEHPAYTIHYPNCYYYFIHEVEKWAYDNVNKQSSCDDVIKLTSSFLKGQEAVQLQKKNKYIIWTYSYETLLSLWQSMRGAIDNDMKPMFQRYWQVMNNNAIRRYKNMSLPLSKTESLAQEKMYYGHILFSTCGYLMYTKDYESLSYALNYTQSSRFERYALPNNISELLNEYVDFRIWYSNMSVQDDFTFSSDYHIHSTFEAVHGVTWFTALMFVMYWIEAKQNNADLSKDVFFKCEKTTEIEKHLRYLLSALVMLKDRYNDYEWLKEFGIAQADVPGKQECEDYINSVMQDYDKRFEADLKKRPVDSARTMFLDNTAVREMKNLTDAFGQFNSATLKHKQYVTVTGTFSTGISKRYFIQALSGTDAAKNKYLQSLMSWKYNIITRLREHFIHKTARTIMISAEEKVLNDARTLVREKYPMLIQYNNIDALNRYTKDEVKKHLGKPLADAIDKRAGMTTPFTWQVVIISFIPELKELLGIKESRSRFHGIKIIDCLDVQNISTTLNRDRYTRYLYNSVFIVRKSDLPFINWNAKIHKEQINANNLELLDEKQKLYMGIRYSEDSAQSEISIYRPYEIWTNDKYFIQLRLDLDNITFEDK